MPLLYLEGALFPSIFWKSAPDKCSIIGAIPSSLLHEFIQKEGFASIPQHIRTRLTSPTSSTNNDPRYCSHSYDTLENMADSHSIQG